MSECAIVQCCPDDPFAYLASVPTSYSSVEQCITLTCDNNPLITSTACAAAGAATSFISQDDANEHALAQAITTAAAALIC